MDTIDDAKFLTSCAVCVCGGGGGGGGRGCLCVRKFPVFLVFLPCGERDHVKLSCHVEREIMLS